ncbi:MAG: hypothetical protein R8G66_06880 [Cytophagales bacterium]|nr:hypothetical protein [Cytophagales bacterium]
MSFIERVSQDPHFIFLIDGIGANITALSLLLVLPNLPEVFTMPANILNYLGTIALVFATYSLCNFFLKPRKAKLLIWIIAIANLAYCLFSGLIVARLLCRLSMLDVVYFLGEILIVAVLATIEFKVAKSIKA